MGIVNAVLAEYGDDTTGGFRWVEHAGSILVVGRREAGLSLSGVRDPAIVDELVNRWMATRFTVRTSYEGTVLPDAGPEPSTGETLTAVDEENARVKSMTWNFIDDEKLEWSPEINSLAEQDEVDTARAFDRLMSIHGGSSSSAAPIWVPGSRVQAGKFEPITITGWGWYGPFDAEDLGDWEPQPVLQPMRCTALEVVATPKGTGGFTVFRILFNGEPHNPDLVVYIDPDHDRGLTRFYLTDTWHPSDKIQIELITLGAHETGSVTVHGVRAT